MDRPEPLDDDVVAHLAKSVCHALAATLVELPPVERTVFILHDILGLSVAAIAPIVGRRPAAVRRLAREAAGRAGRAHRAFERAENRTTGARRAGRVER